MAKTDLTAQRLRELFYYNPETGIFTRRIKRSAEKAGAVSDGRNTIGYVQIGIDYGRYLGHRLAWLYMEGVWPSLVDHINGIRSDNRWINLRLSNKTENSQNMRKATSRNSSGFLGVVPDRNRWCAQIKINGKSVYLGTFNTPELAHEAYLKAKRIAHIGCMI